jgi:IS5 family transposase
VIEATVFRTISGPVPPWESLLPAELLRLPEELARVDALLDDPAFFAPFAPYFHPVLGRPSTPIECYLRLMFLKFRYRLGYESLCAEVSDSISWRRFCRIGMDAKVPHPTTLMTLTTRCGQDAVAGLNEALLVKAAGARLLRTGRVRADTTVIAANVAYPTDVGLLARAVGKLVRAARRVQAAGGATGTVMTDRRRAAGRRAREMAATMRARAKLGRDESSAAIARATGDLADLAETAAAQAAAVLRNGRRAVGRALSGRMRGRLRRALGELAVTVERTATVVAQARSRLAGQMPDGATRLVSLHDPDARPIRKGRIGKPAGVRVQGPGHRQRRRHRRGLQRGMRRRPGRPATGPRHHAGRAPHRARAPHGHRRPRLRPGCRRTRPARRRSAHRCHPPPGHHLSRPQGARAQPRLPQAGQMANRLRRPDQLPQTPLRLEPHPSGQQNGSGDLVRTRGIRPQPGQDRDPRQLTEPAEHPPPHRAGPSPGQRLFQDEVT